MSELIKFIFEVLKSDENKFNEFFFNQLKIGPIKSRLCYDYISNNDTFDINTVIPGIGNVTKQKIFSFDFNSIRYKTPETKVNIEDILFNAFSPQTELNLTDIYARVSVIVKGSNINLQTLKPYKSRNGVELEFEMAKKRQQGFIRSFLEEHSADSRQHWVKGNVVYRNGVAANIFSNDNLRSRNEFIHWRICFRGGETARLLRQCPTKKSGVWKLGASTSKPSDEDFLIMEQELEDRGKGMRGQENPSLKEHVILTRTFISTKC
jgi:hypothetical protein